MAKKETVNDKLDKIISNQEKMLKIEKRILKEELKIEDMELEELTHNKDEDAALAELKKLEEEIRASMGSPMKHVTSKDAFKGMIGALIGLIGHFAFTKAVEVALKIDFFRATLLYIFALVILIVMLYFTGFRAVQAQIILKFLPLRVLVLYSVSIFTIIVIYLVFGIIDININPGDLYKVIGGSIVLAVLGAATADLIGRETWQKKIW